MIVSRVGTNLGSDVIISVPDSATNLIGFLAVIPTADSTSVANQNLGIAVISADLNNTVTQISTGIPTGLLCVANQNFPKIPVSPGERLLVSFLTAGSAVIYFEEV